MKLVLAGDHQQYMDWLARNGGSPGEWRPVLREEHIAAVQAEQVEEFVRTGTYWNSPAFGSEAYQFLMGRGVQLEREWARSWPADWSEAKALRDGEGPARWARDRAKERQDTVERLLGG